MAEQTKETIGSGNGLRARPPRGTILVVDDDLEVRDAVASVLADEGYAVAGAGDGIEALEWLARGDRPRLILLDWKMPRCDGLHFRQRQLADPAISSIPVVVLTAYRRGDRVSSRDDAALARLALSHTLRKPVGLDLLLDVVARAIDPNGPLAP